MQLFPYFHYVNPIDSQLSKRPAHKKEINGDNQIMEIEKNIF